MQSEVLGGRGAASAHVPAAQHAASKTSLRVAVDGLPAHATPAELKRRLAMLGLEASACHVQLNPLSGDANGRGELTFRGVVDKQQLLDLLHAQPDALLHGRAVQITFDDTTPKGSRPA